MAFKASGYVPQGLQGQDGLGISTLYFQFYILTEKVSGEFCMIFSTKFFKSDKINISLIKLIIKVIENDQPYIAKNPL